ncbi:MAG: outer membrane beta-barrel protein [Alphaproteobacteria bacterium]|nr:outer membrane beta-barrel protein [Alphaproteobacteria bacterium]
MTRIFYATCLATGLAAASAGVAVAQPRGENPFSGFYIGGEVGYDSYGINNEPYLPDYIDQGAEGNRLAGLGGDGIAGGAVLGYNVPLGDALILGAEGSFRYSDASGDTSLSNSSSDSKVDFNSRESWALMGRVGFMISDRTMLYGSGGWGQTHFGTRFTNTPDSGDSSILFDHGTTRDAWRVGGGIETALGGNWTARLDYTYSNYSGYDITVAPGDTLHVDPQSHQFTLGVNYYF